MDGRHVRDRLLGETNSHIGSARPCSAAEKPPGLASHLHYFEVEGGPMEPVEDLAIQGNAVAGSPDSVFAIDVTAADVKCPACEGISPLADERAYLHGSGSLLRCKHCTSVLGRFRRSRDAVWIDLRAATSWQLQLPH